MSHRYSTGQNVYYDPQFGNNASRGKYKIVRQLPIERDNRLSYRIKSTTESFERIAEEHQLNSYGLILVPGCAHLLQRLSVPFPGLRYIGEWRCN